jgi:hypothetical protein
MKFRLSLSGDSRTPACFEEIGLSGMEAGGSVEKSTSRSCRNDISGVGGVIGDGIVSPRSEDRLGNDTATGVVEVFVGNRRGFVTCRTAFGFVIPLIMIMLSSSPSSKSKSSPFAHRALGDTANFDGVVPTVGILTE